MASLPDTRTLYFLGRRVERLIFGGILLAALSFADAYLTTANRQFVEDYSTGAVTNLLDRLELEKPSLSFLFQAITESPTPLTSRLSELTENQKLINETRKKLGLPPSSPPKPSKPLPKPQTYREALDNIVSELGKNHIDQRKELEKYIDPTKSPEDLIQVLHKQLKLLENKPSTVWGIETPRLLQLQYGGMDYKFPFGFVSSMLAIALAPLIVGWLGALYTTRQRELAMIAAIDVMITSWHFRIS